MAFSWSSRATLKKATSFAAFEVYLHNEPQANSEKLAAENPATGAQSDSTMLPRIKRYKIRIDRLD